MSYYVMIRIPQNRIDKCGGNTSRMEHLIKSILDQEPLFQGKVWGPCKNKAKLVQTKRIAPLKGQSSSSITSTSVLRREHLDTAFIERYPEFYLQNYIIPSKPTSDVILDLQNLLNNSELSPEYLLNHHKDLFRYHTDAVFIEDSWHLSRKITHKDTVDLDWNRSFLWKFLKFKPKDLILILEISL